MQLRFGETQNAKLLAINQLVNARILRNFGLFVRQLALDFFLGRDHFGLFRDRRLMFGNLRLRAFQIH